MQSQQLTGAVTLSLSKSLCRSLRYTSALFEQRISLSAVVQLGILLTESCIKVCARGQRIRKPHRPSRPKLLINCDRTVKLYFRLLVAAHDSQQPAEPH